MKDEGIKEIKQKWLKANKPKTKIGYSFQIPEYTRELVTLDGTGSVLGSYHAYLTEQEDGRIRYDVYNDTGWESGTRMPNQIGTTQDSSLEDMVLQRQPFSHHIKSILNNRERREFGPGGTFRQHYYWYE